MYSEYQIKAAFIKVLNQALSETGVSGYLVLSGNPPNMTNEDNVVLVEKLNTRRKGFQSREVHIGTKLSEQGELVHYFQDMGEVWIEEITWQVTVLHKKTTDDTISSMTGEDVLKRIQMWLNSPNGAKAMRGRTDVPMAPVHVFQARVQQYPDDSDIHQQADMFDFQMVVLQTWQEDPKFIQDVRYEIHSV